jgi:hypothetical protein
MAGVALAGLGLVALAILADRAADAEAARRRRPGGAAFSAFIDDLPIMPGLSESDDGYVFDLFQGGRLAESRLSGEADTSVVRGFYAATLTQLGWRPSGSESYVYTRGREKLIFLVEAAPPRRGRSSRGLEVVFVITPLDRSAPPAAAPGPGPR